jgi:hypothetical protein
MCGKALTAPCLSEIAWARNGRGISQARRRNRLVRFPMQSRQEIPRMFREPRRTAARSGRGLLVDSGRPQQDSNLRTRLRRALRYTALTWVNDSYLLVRGAYGVWMPASRPVTAVGAHGGGPQSSLASCSRRSPRPGHDRVLALPATGSFVGTVTSESDSRTGLVEPDTDRDYGADHTGPTTQGEHYFPASGESPSSARAGRSRPEPQEFLCSRSYRLVHSHADTKTQTGSGSSRTGGQGRPAREWTDWHVTITAWTHSPPGPMSDYGHRLA